MKWLKGLSWVAIAGAIGAAIMMVLRARSAGKIEAKIAAGETRIKKLNEGTQADINTAAKLQRNIEAKKIDARIMRKKSEASLERIGQDETMADIAERFNGKRVVRARSNTAT